MHTDSDKCQPASFCYALTRGSLINVRKGESGFSKTLIEFEGDILQPWQ